MVSLRSSLLCLLVVVVASVPVTVEKPSWIDNPSFKAAAMGRTPYPVNTYNVNMDLDPEHRWDEVGAAFKDKAYKLVDYIDELVPKSLMPIVEAVGDKLDSYKGFGDFGAEMKGLARSLNVSLSYIVVGNLIYQLEHLGINCTARNTTGPCPPKSDGIVYPFRRSTVEDGPSGYCTSIVAEDPTGKIVHARNMDWNLPLALRQMYINVNFQTNNKTVFTGTTLVGFTGIFNAFRSGAWSWTIDARDQGGAILTNILEMILHGSQPPLQHARRALYDSTTYDDAITKLTQGDVSNPAYFIVGGVSKNEGAVVSRDRNKPGDVWSINASTFYRLETNYDHWDAVPSYDDRRTYADRYMDALGEAHVNATSMLKVVETWPVFNHHTDMTSIIVPKDGVYNVVYWSD